MNRRYLLAAVLLLGLAGCGGYRRAADEAVQIPAVPYERVWVDPRITFSDSLITLMYAFRVDSIPAETAVRPTYEPPQVEFEVQEFTCPVVVNLLDAEENVIYPLLRRDLNAGHYRLSFEPSRFKAALLLPGIYYLRAQGCGLKQQSRFVFQ